MTIASVRAAIRQLDMTATWQPHYAEWRIDYRPSDVRHSAETAYYTSDHADALATAVHMARRERPAC